MATKPLLHIEKKQGPMNLFNFIKKTDLESFNCLSFCDRLQNDYMIIIYIIICKVLCKVDINNIFHVVSFCDGNGHILKLALINFFMINEGVSCC